MNVLVILADSFRPDHLGCFGNPWIKTPHLDALARESVRFRQATAEDPRERRNLVDLEGERAAAMAAQLDGFLARCGTPARTPGDEAARAEHWRFCW